MSTTEIINPVWDVFSKSIDDKSIESFELIKYRTKQSILNATENNNVTTVINIEIDDLDSFLLPSKGYLQVKFKLVNDANGNALANTDVTSLCSNGLQLFKKCNYRMSGMDVEETQEVGYASLASAFVHMNKEYAESVSDSQWFYPEKAHIQYGDDNDFTTNSTIPKIRGGGAVIDKYFESGTSADSVGNEKASRNESYEKRFARCSSSSECEMWIPLERIFGFCRDYKSVLRGVRHEFQFDRNTDYNQVIHSAAGGGVANVRPVIMQLNVWMPRLRPSISALATIEKELEDAEPAKILYNNWSAYFTPDQTETTTQLNYRLPPIYGKPVKAFVAVQNLSKYQNQLDAGDVNANNDPADPTVGQNAVNNPMTFIAGGVNNFGSLIGITNINRMVLRINGQPYPLEAYAEEFNSAGTGDLYGRAYSEFLRVCGKSPYGDEASIVDKHTYKYCYPLFAFDLDQNISGYKKGDTAEIEIQAQFSNPGNAATRQAFRLVIFIASEKEKTILPSGKRISIIDA